MKKSKIFVFRSKVIVLLNNTKDRSYSRTFCVFIESFTKVVIKSNEIAKIYEKTHVRYLSTVLYKKIEK